MLKLEHLTEDQVKQLIDEYYDGGNIKQLLSKYQVKLIPSRLVNHFPPVVLDNCCPYCETALICTHKSRTSSSRYSDPICPKCGHQENETCSCKTCIEYRRLQKEQENKAKHALIVNMYHPDSTIKVKEDSLTLKERLFLSVLLRAGLEESMEFILPANGYKNRLGSTEEFRNTLILDLSNRGLIRPHISSDISAFEEGENFPRRYYIYHVRYALNIQPIDGNYQSLIQRLMYPNSELFLEDQNFCYEMWREIARNEVLEYLLYSMEKVKFSFSPGKKTLAVIDGLLDSFSVSQIYNIIYRSIANATKYFQETGIPKKQAANLVIVSVTEKRQQQRIGTLNHMVETLIVHKH